MKWHDIANELGRRTGDMYHERMSLGNKVPSIEEIRLRKIRSKVVKHETWLANRAIKIKRFKTARMWMDRFQRDLDNTVVAIDLEFKRYRDHTLIREFGVAYFEDGVIYAENYLTEGCFLKKEFRFGEHIVLPYDDMKNVISGWVQNASMIVGHNLRSDFEVIERNGIDFGHVKIADTSHWFAEMSISHIPSLSEACSLFGIDSIGAHNAGNDAYYNLLLAKKMSEKGRIIIQPNTSKIIIN